MSKTTKGTGSCLCGGVRVSVANLSNSAGACHCGMCRKWGGGPLMVADCGTDVSFEGDENISIFDSSQWAERGFCKKCGSHLFYKLKQSEQYFLAAGMFDDDSAFVFDHQVFIDEKPAFYAFANDTVDMTGAELFAKYASPSD